MSREYRNVSDEELAEILTIGTDDAACDELFGRYRQKIYLWCFTYTHEAEEAIDLTQEIFIKVFRGIGRFKGGSRLSTWIYRIVRNHCLSRLGSRRRLWRRRLLPVDELEVADPTATDRLREAELQGQLDDLLDRAARRMAADELEAFVLHYREGLTVKEITKTLGCDNATGARTLIQNARRKFKRLTAGKEDLGG